MARNGLARLVAIGILSVLGSAWGSAALASACALSASGSVGSSVTDGEIIPFVAYRIGSTTPAYKGEYRVCQDSWLIEEKQVYRTMAGTPVLEVHSVFDSAQRRPVSYESHNFQDDTTIHARVEGDTLRYTISDRTGRVTGSGQTRWSASDYLWPNIIHVVEENWGLLVAGKDLSLDLFLFTHAAKYSFSLGRVDETSMAGKEAVRLELRPTSLLVRMLTSGITLTFSRDHPGQLLEYEGRSVLTDASGKAQDLRIVLGARRPA
jgi:hypothetical protein